MIIGKDGENLRVGEHMDKSNPKDAFGSRKPAIHLVPPALVLWVSEVFKKSAPEYGPFNWRSTEIRHSVYLDATARHLLALIDGQWFDAKTGIPHWAHIGANAAIGLDTWECGTLIHDLNWPSGPAPRLIDNLTEKIK